MLIVDDIDKVNLLDLVLDWEDKYMKLGTPMPKNPSFWYYHTHKKKSFGKVMIYVFGEIYEIEAIW